ncbi:MAG: methyltransferase, partial [Chloroflexi bacterium]
MGMLTESGVVCPVCGRGMLQVFARLEGVPVFCNVLWSSPEAARTAPRGDITLGFCGVCGHVANTSFEVERMAYTAVYENSLHFSPRFQQYAVELAERLISRYGLRGKQIVEIGAGQGDFLRLLCELG